MKTPFFKVLLILCIFPSIKALSAQFEDSYSDSFGVSNDGFFEDPFGVEPFGDFSEDSSSDSFEVSYYSSDFFEAVLDTLVIDSNKNSYSIDYQLYPNDFLLIKDDKKKFAEHFADLFNEYLKTEKISKIISDRKINKPNYKSIGTPLPVRYSKIRQTLLKELDEFENGLWQDIAKVKLLDDQYKPISIEKFKKSCLMDSLNKVYELIPGTDRSDPSNYTAKFEVVCMLKPFKSVLNVHDEQLYFGLKFNNDELSTIYIRIQDLPEKLYCTKKLLSNTFVGKKLIKEINASSTSLRITEGVIDDPNLEFQFLDTIYAEKFNWIYAKKYDDRPITEANLQRLDYLEYALNKHFLQTEAILIEGKDPADPLSYEKKMVPCKGQFLYFNINNGDPDDEFLSLVVETEIKNSKRTDKLVGFQFNANNVVFFDDYQGEISEEMYDYFWLLYELSNT